MLNAALVEIDLGGGQNGYLGNILLPKQYARISDTAFVCLTDLGRTATVPYWTTTREDQSLLQYHK